jgi:hypothetical protein
MGLFDEIASEIGDEIVAEAIGRSMADEGAPTLEAAFRAARRCSPSLRRAGRSRSATSSRCESAPSVCASSSTDRRPRRHRHPARSESTVAAHGRRDRARGASGPRRPLEGRDRFRSPSPVVRMPEATGPAARPTSWRRGTEVTVVVQGYTPMGILNHRGEPVYVLRLAVTAGRRTPYEVEVGNVVRERPVVAHVGRRDCTPGGNDPGEVVVDWARGAVTGS